LDTLVIHGRLDNGLTYYIRRNNYPVKKVAFLFTVKAGYMQQEIDQVGLAHLLEHMGMKSTVHFSNVWAFLKSLGVQPGSESNAGTGRDETFYWFLVSADSMNIRRSLLLLSEIAHGIKLDKEGIDSEKGVVINEISRSGGYQQKIYEKYYPLLIRHSEYAARYKNASEEIGNLERFDHKLLTQFYDKWYCAGLESISVVGDIDVDSTKYWVDQYFKGIPSCGRDEKGNYEATLEGDNLFQIIADSIIPNTEVKIFMKHFRNRLITKEDYRIDVLKELFDDILRQRIARINNAEERPFYTISHSILDDDLLNLEALSFDVKCKAGKVEAGFKAVITEIERIKRYGISEAELVRSKRSLRSRFENSIDTSSIGLASRYKSHFLGTGGGNDITNEFNLRACILDHTTCRDLDSLTKSWLADANRDIFVLRPESAENNPPGEQTVLNWWQDVKDSNIPVINYDGPKIQLMASGEQAKKNRLKFRKSILDSGVVKYTLSNGTTLIFKPLASSTRSVADKIQMNVFKSGGTSDLNEVNSFFAEAALDIVAGGGLGEMSSSELAMFLRENSISIYPYIHADVSGFNGVSLRENFEIMLQVFYKYFSDPVKSKLAFLAWQERRQLNKIPDSQQLFRDSIDALTGFRRSCSYCKGLNPGLNSIYNLYRSIFSDVSQFTFVFSGEFDVDTILPIVLNYIQALPAKHKYHTAAFSSNHYSGRKEGICKTIYAGDESDKSSVEIQIDLHEEFNLSIENNSTLDVLASILQNRLDERLRVHEGGTYLVIAQVNYMERPFKRYQIRINFDCLLRDLRRMQSAAMEELHSVFTLDGDEFNQVVAAELQSLSNKLNSQAFWTSYMSRQYRLGRNFSEIYKQLSFLRDLKIGEFKHSIGNYIRNASISSFTMLPRKYAGDIKSICETEF